MGGGVQGPVGGGGQGGCDRIIIIIKTLFKEEAQLDVHPIFPGVELKCLRKIHKKNSGGVGLGGSGGCDRRIEVFVKIQKNNWGRPGGGGWGEGSGWGGVRVDVNEELKFL